MNKNLSVKLLIIGVALHVISLANGIMEVDATLYAVIAKHIAISGDWINLIANGHDWLDKPHLPFWITAVSFKVFGINDFAYKVPAFISFLVGVYYCYRLANILFDKAAARLSTVIYITSLHLYLSVFDVRAEAYLTTFIIAATYHLFKSMQSRFSLHILWAAAYCAAACITKGVFVCATIAAGFIIYWVYNKNWKEFLQPKWWLLILLSVIFILPELYCLYTQFDLHPEKIVFGKSNISGIRFYFWDSQFGRFLNNGPIKGEGDPFFFLHTFLWAFLPWSIIACSSIFFSFKNLCKENSSQLILSGAFIVTFILFSLSKFQLPHYLVIVFPHIAILSSTYLLGIKKEVVLKRWNIVQTIIFFISVIAVCTLLVITKFHTLKWPLMLVVAAILVFFFCFRQTNLDALAGKAFCFSALLFSYMGLFFYPALLEYQGGQQAGELMAKEYPNRNAAMFKCSSYSFEWNIPGVVNRFENLESVLQKDSTMIVFTTPENIESLAHQSTIIKEIGRFKTFPVSQLTLPFLNAATRNNELDYFLLLECKGN